MRIRATIAALALSVSAVGVSAAPAVAHDANTAPCVTEHEYDHVGVLGDWNRAKVHDLFDFDGSEVWQRDGREKRHYRVCDSVGDAGTPDNWYHVHVWYSWNGVYWDVDQKEWCGGC